MMNVYILFTYVAHTHTHTGDFIHGQFYFLTTFCFLPDMINIDPNYYISVTTKSILSGKKICVQFGDEVYDIFTTSKDQKELEMKIVAAFDRVRGNIEKQSAKVAAAGSTSDDEE